MTSKTQELKKPVYSAAVPSYQSQADHLHFQMAEDLFKNSSGSTIEKIDAFPKYCTRKALAKFISRYEVFKEILNVNGSIVECGVLHGGGLFTWAKLSSIFEPFNHSRLVYGFDTFEGFPSVNAVDEKGASGIMQKGSLTGSALEEIERAVDLFDTNRPLNHIRKVHLVKGDVCKTAKPFVQDNPHLIVSLLYLDCDLYDPTRAALEAFLPRMPKGAIVVCDEANARSLPGETAAVQEIVGIRNLEMKRFSHDSYFSYWKLV